MDGTMIRAMRAVKAPDTTAIRRNTDHKMKTIRTTNVSNNMENTAYGYCPPYGAWHFSHRRAALASGVRVNVEETDNAFNLQVFAPGLVKENFSVSVHNDVLYIAYKDLQDVPKGKFTLKEYDPKEFERSFSLNGKVDVERISVSYGEGILRVTLPRTRV
jgi:HSP20 family protein